MICLQLVASRGVKRPHAGEHSMRWRGRVQRRGLKTSGRGGGDGTDVAVVVAVVVAVEAQRDGGW